MHGAHQESQPERVNKGVRTRRVWRGSAVGVRLQRCERTSPSLVTGSQDPHRAVDVHVHAANFQAGRSGLQGRQARRRERRRRLLAAPRARGRAARRRARAAVGVRRATHLGQIR